MIKKERERKNENNCTQSGKCRKGEAKKGVEKKERETESESTSLPNNAEGMNAHAHKGISTQKVR